MKVAYREAARDDVVRQFRYYLVAAGVPEIAIRFRNAVRDTVQSLRQHPLLGSRYQLRNTRLRGLRSWPVAGFEAIRVYYLTDDDTVRVVRVLHGKRDVKRILEHESTADDGPVTSS